MNTNDVKLTLELGPESMAKLDKILEALQGAHHDCDRCVSSATDMVSNAMQTGVAPTEEPTPVETTAPEEEHPIEEPSPYGEPEQPEPAAEPEPEEPKYTKDDILALVQKLAAPNNPKREQAKAIVKAYAAKVSDIPADKYAEVMDKLTALTKEG